MKRFLGALNHLPETRLAGIQGFPASGGSFHVSEKRVSGSLSFDQVQVEVLGFVPLGQTPDKDVFDHFGTISLALFSIATLESEVEGGSSLSGYIQKGNFFSGLL